MAQQDRKAPALPGGNPPRPGSWNRGFASTDPERQRHVPHPPQPVEHGSDRPRIPASRRLDVEDEGG